MATAATEMKHEPVELDELEDLTEDQKQKLKEWLLAGAELYKQGDRYTLNMEDASPGMMFTTGGKWSKPGWTVHIGVDFDIVEAVIESELKKAREGGATREDEP